MLKAAIAGLVLSVSSVANAGIIFDDSTAGELTVSWNETHTLSSSDFLSSYLFLVVENAFNTEDGAGYVPANNIEQYGSINGGSSFLLGDWNGWQYRGGPEFDYDTKDLIFGLNSSSMPTFNIGDEFTWSGMMTFSTDGSIFRLADNANNFSTTSYLANISGRHSLTSNTTINSASVDIPEPSTLAIFVLAIMGLASRKVKK